jgi:sugar (pentulose or hexulose) kinase
MPKGNRWRQQLRGLILGPRRNTNGFAPRSGVLLDSIGTSESLNSVLPKPVFDERLAAHGLAQGAIWIDESINYLTGGLLTAGAAIEWVRREIGGELTIAELVQEASLADQAVPVFSTSFDTQFDTLSRCPGMRRIHWN